VYLKPPTRAPASCLCCYRQERGHGRGRRRGNLSTSKSNAAKKEFSLIWRKSHNFCIFQKDQHH